jgi:hypothetical protein
VQVAQRIDRVAAGVERLKHAFGVGKEALSDLGQADATAGTLEQSLAKVAFERLDAGGNGWLGEEQGFGSATKAALVGYLYKRF